MRFLGMGEHVALGDMYLRLAAKGHEVRVYADDVEARDDIMRGMLQFTTEWKNELDWVRSAGDEGIILFETSTHGDLQAELRSQGYNVIGGSPLGTRLEIDRPYAQQVMRETMDVQAAATHHFTSFDAGIRFLLEHPGRFVFKMNGAGYASFRNYVGELTDGTDVVAVLSLQRDRWTFEETPDFVLMEHVQGVEIGVGAYFDGEHFLEPACLDWEHKRFFNGDLGELTGEMGTLVTYRGYERLFERTLARMTPLLAQDGYVGYINLNTIVTERGIFPLEFTTRFGYPGFAILDALHLGEGWAGIFSAMATRKTLTFPTHPGYALGVVLTVPPFPYSYGYANLSKGIPISFSADMTDEDRQGLHHSEVAMEAGRLVTAGTIGYVTVVTGRGERAELARARAYSLAKKVSIPNVRYRTDIGERFIREDRDRLIQWGWLEPSGEGRGNRTR
ncbi:MAG: phosphoribosylglycinamide synthetase C domain-containing protein [Gemmatimonadaceae bacterium]